MVLYCIRIVGFHARKGPIIDANENAGYISHQGYLYKKESIFKSTRYWAAVAQSRLFLFTDINSASCKESHNLEDAYLKRHKKEPKKFLVQLSGTYKNKNAKQEYQTDNCDLAQTWILHLENAIATAGKTPNTRRKLSTIKLGESHLDIIFNRQYIWTQ